MKRTPITLRFDPKLLEAARKAAEQDNRTLTNWIETLILKETGGAK